MTAYDAPVEAPQLEVRSLLELGDTTFVIARHCGGGEVEVNEGSLLGGLQIEPELDRPRTSQLHAEVTTDLFIFTLQHKDDAGQLSIGQVVSLTNP